VDLEERLNFNTAISSIMELLNAAQDFAPVESAIPAEAGPLRRAVEGVLLMLAPYAPHAAEEAWSLLGRSTPLSRTAWPAYDPARLVEASATVAVQVSGKLRGQVVVPRDAPQEQAVEAARADANVARHLEGQSVVKVVYVPNRMLNIVVRPS
jgi:leucyl-tRNA synthetase